MRLPAAARPAAPAGRRHTADHQAHVNGRWRTCADPVETLSALTATAAGQPGAGQPGPAAAHDDHRARARGGRYQPRRRLNRSNAGPAHAGVPASSARIIPQVPPGRAGAGLLLGFYQGSLDEPRARAAARLLIAAGADETLIPQWTEEGRRRAEGARYPPFSQPR